MNIFLLVIYSIGLVIYCAVTSIIQVFIPRRFRKKKDITGKTVLITGAGSGVGRQLAVEFSKHATRLVLVDINRKGLLQTERLLDRSSPVFVYDCDVSDYAKVYEMATKVKMEVGDVDILVNNAGIISGKYLVDLPEEKIIKTMEVNTLAHFWTCKAFLPAMMKKNSGHIVTIASIAGRTGGAKATDYCASKFAAIGFAESLECEMRERDLDGIKVTIVCPSHIDTGLFAGVKITLGRILTPEYVAQEVVTAVRLEEDILYIPQFWSYLAIFQLTPRWLLIKFMELTDNLGAMRNFTGREQNGTSEKPKKIE